ncbi:hypothetical protein AUR64_09940 [Haloprofundus marisrubri]|uniref:Uncharacterized protein n=1 Tax=Haloprofundus marisrubri TaxID=1514971 RepID=A0A0W1R9C7_9EURY|nr:hypothetical protein [Haloprofundus marisrubri]KTG09934.1 hypothetical protein AUR64_09940 [Haloprofundus marisrubri]
MDNGNSNAGSGSTPAARSGVSGLASRLSLSTDQLRFVGIGVATGLLVALAAYGFNRTQMVAAVPSMLPFVAGLLGGAYVHLLSEDLAESVRAFIVALVVSTACYVVAAMAPLWILSYDPVTRDLLIQSILREEIARLVFTSLIPQLFIGYLGAVVVDGTFWS